MKVFNVGRNQIMVIMVENPRRRHVGGLWDFATGLFLDL